MKSYFSSYSIALILLFSIFSGCSNQHKDSMQKESVESAAAMDTVALSQEANTPEAGSENNIPALPARKFIRTADIKFKTRDVYQATEKIEDLTRKYQGFVTHTNLTTNITQTFSTRISADSLLEQSQYVVENNMSLRVPNTKLDSLLKEIGSVAAFLDYRVINADDVSLRILENSLKIKRNQQAGQRVEQAIENRGKKLTETIQAEESLLEKQLDADTRTIRNITYTDQVNYSTVKLSFYQPATSIQTKVYTFPQVKEYEPALSTRLYDSFITGWLVFEVVLVFIVKMWALLLLSIAAFWLYRKYGYRIAK